MPLASAPEGDFLAAIGYLATLAFPNSFEHRDKFVEAAKAHLVKLYGRKRHPRAAALRKSPLWRYSTRAILDSGPITKAAYLVARRRFPAAEVANAILVRTVTLNTSLRIEVEIKSLAIRSANTGAAAFGGDRENWIHRVWAETKPVLHLAQALLTHLNECGWVENPPNAWLWRLIERPEWARVALKRAQVLRILMAGPPLRIKLEDTVVLLGGNADSETIASSRDGI